eukprot:CFRG4933T1
MSDSFDGVLMSVAQQHDGIDALLTTFFSFLQRKTDFFTAASEKDIFNAIKKVVNEQKAISNRTQQKEKATKPSTANSHEPKAVSAPSVSLDEGPKTVELSDKEEPTAGAKGTSAPPSTVPKVAELTEDGKKKANSGNGGSTDKYTWTQTLDDVEVRVPLPVAPDTMVKGKEVVVSIQKKHIKVGLRGEPLYIDADLEADLKSEDCFWTIEDRSVVVLNLQKLKGMGWWSRVCTDEEEIDTKTVEPETSNLNDLDGSTRGMVEKMMYDQRQKEMGLPSSDEQNKQKMMQNFMDQHPEMDFSSAKFN